MKPYGNRNPRNQCIYIFFLVSEFYMLEHLEIVVCTCSVIFKRVFESHDFDF